VLIAIGVDWTARGRCSPSILPESTSSYKNFLNAATLNRPGRRAAIFTSKFLVQCNLAQTLTGCHTLQGLALACGRIVCPRQGLGAVRGCPLQDRIALELGDAGQHVQHQVAIAQS
jgi:hypothetical protein